MEYKIPIPIIFLAYAFMSHGNVMEMFNDIVIIF